MSACAEFRACVTDVRLKSRTGEGSLWLLALDKTEFDAGETGVLEAIAPSGTRLAIPVLDVTVDEAGTAWHLVEKPLVVGAEVEARVAFGFGAGMMRRRMGPVKKRVRRAD